MKRVCWLILVGLLLGCGAEVTPTATAVPATFPAAETAAEAEAVPTDTAVPPEPTATPPLPTLPPRPSQPTAVPSPVPANVPELVWLPYAIGDYGQPVLMLEDGEIAPQPMPVEVEIFFDYEAGWLAYGSEFWGATDNQQSVTDLYIYYFTTGRNQAWASGNIGRAALSPVNENSGQPYVAVAVHNGSGFDLVVKLGPGDNIPLLEDVDPFFSWSPDGSQIAYLRDGELFVTSAVRDSGNSPIASGVYAEGGWIGDAPLWLGDLDYLLYADAPFTIVAVDGSETIVPTAVDGTALQGPRPFAMLYSPTTNQLIVESEGMFGPSVAVYQLGSEFETAELVEQIDDAQLAGWNEENESVIIVSGGEPTMRARIFC